MIAFNLGQYQNRIEAALIEMRQERILERIWWHDHTVWKPEPEEISNRLGWLHSAGTMRSALPEIQALVDSVRQAGYTQALLLGMGGSSLAPEVFRKTFGVQPGYLDLAVLDSTDPGAVLAYARQFDPARSLYIVSTKSGGTVETFSFYKYFYNQALEALGSERAGEHFIAITDPGSRLAEIGREHGFRAVFLNDPHIGGRYSALSYFGLLPAALVGLEVSTLLERAHALASQSKKPRESDDQGAILGAALGELAKAGRDKLTLLVSPQIASFGDWLEQLIAESTGKGGQGILPVVGEQLGPAEVYGQDRLFVSIQLEGDPQPEEALQALEGAGHPLVRVRLQDKYDLGGQFFLWELATAVAGYRLSINPFDQPDVEAAKVLARQMVSAYQAQGSLPEPEPDLVAGGLRVYADPQLAGDLGQERASPAQALLAFLEHAQPGAYLALQAYVQPSAEVGAALTALRHQLQAYTRLATTVGYGPRFLHSTGQLHKGDAGLGFFIQITADSPEDAPIPDEAGSPGSSISFAVLKAAQALGDRQALLEAGRRVLRFHFTSDVAAGLLELRRALT
ncbi:MAG TPA: hypothetical protein VLA49_16645 [Anaerolineales bacterium]|nr:hypothetical protein [Anaerolineales bacterium]